MIGIHDSELFGSRLLLLSCAEWLVDGVSVIFVMHGEHRVLAAIMLHQTRTSTWTTLKPRC
jgi:hypothetical protein